MRKLVITTAVLLFSSVIIAQKISVEEYINTYKNIAIEEMKRSGIPASVTLAQGILETENGNSDLVKKSNNHFGIKCKSTWTGESVKHTDDAPNECFRKYSKAADSYKDHSDYLKTSPRYASLFQLDPTDYKGWAYGLKRAGYATNPRYPQIVISNIEKYNLQQYDNVTVDDGTMAAATSQVNVPSAVQVSMPITSYENNALTKAIGNKTKFNGLKAIFASKGTSLLAIATVADIDLSRLMEINDLEIDGLLKEDQFIYLEKKNKQGSRDSYTTLQKESLYDISQSNGIQLKTLLNLNKFSAHEMIKVGTKINLR
jgi:hypothetical protein